MLGPDQRFRRLATVAAAALVLGVAVHGVCQAIEHDEGVKDAAALCAAAVGLVAVVVLIGGSRRRLVIETPRWIALSVPVPDGLKPAPSRLSAAWLQRFQN